MLSSFQNNGVPYKYVYKQSVHGFTKWNFIYPTKHCTPYIFGDRIGNKIHFLASWGEEFSNSAISKELSTIFSDHEAINSNPVHIQELLSSTLNATV